MAKNKSGRDLARESLKNLSVINANLWHEAWMDSKYDSLEGLLNDIGRKVHQVGKDLTKLDNKASAIDSRKGSDTEAECFQKEAEDLIDK